MPNPVILKQRRRFAFATTLIAIQIGLLGTVTAQAAAPTNQSTLRRKQKTDSRICEGYGFLFPTRRSNDLQNTKTVSSSHYEEWTAQHRQRENRAAANKKAGRGHG